MKTPAGLFWCLLFQRRFADGAQREAEEVLADGDGVFFACEELGNTARRRGVYGNVDLRNVSARRRQTSTIEGGEK